MTNWGIRRSKDKPVDKYFAEIERQKRIERDTNKDKISDMELLDGTIYVLDYSPYCDDEDDFD